MIRYIAAAILACLYVIVSVLVVRSEGQSYRAKLEATGVRREPPARADAPLSESAAATEVSAPARTDLKPEPAPSDPPRPKPPRAELANAEPQPKASPPPTPPPPERKAETAAVPANSDFLANDSFWGREDRAKVWDLARLTAEDERRLGSELRKLIVSLNPESKDAKKAEWEERIADAVAPILEKRTRKDIEYTFTILDWPAVNAFSTPGGYVYVSRGLLDFIGQDEDYALQFAIGHEIAHVELQHALECLKNKSLMDLKLGTLQKLYLIIIPFGYLIDDEAKVDQELDADDWIVRKMQGLGRTRREILVFLKRFEGYATTHGFASGRIKPDRESAVSPLENHYPSQTAARKRVKHLNELLDKAVAKTK
jgi:hypothetical protein